MILPIFDEDKTLDQLPVVVLDTETTGLHAWAGHRIAELAAVRYENWQPVAQISQLLNPERLMDPGASAVNGITDTDLADKPIFATIAAQLLELVDGAIIVAHNAPFDAGFIGVELRLAGHYDPAAIGTPILPNPWLDTLKLARGYFTFDKNNLSHIARLLGVRVGRAHRALNDVEMTTEVLKRMVQQLGKTSNMQTAGDLLHAQGGAVYTPSVPSAVLSAPLDTALTQQQRIQIVYASGDEITTRIIRPRYLTQFKKHAYVVAWCELREEQRTFRLDRIRQPQLIM